MTPAQDLARAREQEAQDLADIAELKRTVAWERYWLRRLKMKREGFALKFKNDPMTHEEREVMRQRVLLMEEIEKILDTDQGSIRASTPHVSTSQ